MNKLAIFVEGQTEQMFVARLLKEVAGRNQIIINKEKIYGKSYSRASIYQISGSIQSSGYEYYVNIIDCGGHERVKTVIRDNYDGLVNSEFQAIIGIRDVYPEFVFSEIPKLRNGLGENLKADPIHVVFVLCVMEIEAWFIAQHSHFLNIDNQLTIPQIKDKVGYDPSVDDVQRRKHPSQDLKRIYSLRGIEYKKNKKKVQKTINALDFGSIYLELGQKFKDLRILNDSIDQFLPRPA